MFDILKTPLWVEKDCDSWNQFLRDGKGLHKEHAFDMKTNQSRASHVVPHIPGGNSPVP